MEDCRSLEERRSPDRCAQYASCQRDVLFGRPHSDLQGDELQFLIVNEILAHSPSLGQGPGSRQY